MKNKNEEQQRILQMVQTKIDEAKSINDIKSSEKYQALYRLISNQFRPFFSKVDMGMAYSILEDIGVPKEELKDTYTKLVGEEIKENRTYVYVDPKDHKNINLL